MPRQVARKFARPQYFTPPTSNLNDSELTTAYTAPSSSTQYHTNVTSPNSTSSLEPLDSPSGTSLVGNIGGSQNPKPSRATASIAGNDTLLGTSSSRNESRASTASASVNRRSSQITTNKTKKKRKAPGILVMREIRRLQNTTDLLIPRLPFQRVVREVTQTVKTDIGKRYRGGFGGGGDDPYRFTHGALGILQEATEAFLTGFFEDVNLAAIHGRRVTVLPRDFSLVVKLRHDSDTGVGSKFKTHSN